MEKVNLVLPLWKSYEGVRVTYDESNDRFALCSDHTDNCSDTYYTLQKAVMTSYCDFDGSYVKFIFPPKTKRNLKFSIITNCTGYRHKFDGSFYQFLVAEMIYFLAKRVGINCEMTYFDKPGRLYKKQLTFNSRIVYEMKSDVDKAMFNFHFGQYINDYWAII